MLDLLISQSNSMRWLKRGKKKRKREGWTQRKDKEMKL
jgi:hypothetical protein